MANKSTPPSDAVTTATGTSATRVPAESLPPIVVKILDCNNSPRLFCDASQQESKVRFATSSSAGILTVTFQEQEAPLQGVGSCFEVFPGAEVELAFKPGIEGDYHFDLEPEHGTCLTDLVLATSKDGSLDKVGFSAPKSDLCTLQIFTESSDGSLTLLVENETDAAQVLDLRDTGDPPVSVTVEANDSETLTFSGSGTRKELKISLRRHESEKTKLPPSQSGGTEQVEVIVEPDA